MITELMQKGNATCVPFLYSLMTSIVFFLHMLSIGNMEAREDIKSEAPKTIITTSGP